MSEINPTPKIIVIRRDNIGDLVCTTPLLTSLRRHFPHGRIDALVNSYNVAVLQNNADIDHVYAYTKAKHRQPGQTVPGVYWDRLRLMLRLRREHYDYVIIASTHFLVRPLRLARLIRPRHIVGFVENGKSGGHHVDLAVPYHKPRPMHLVEELAQLLPPLGIREQRPPAMNVVPDPALVSRLQAGLPQPLQQRPRVGIHISARKVSQRWPAERFVEVMRTLHRQYGVGFMLFWSPGSEDNPLHPGDDAKAEAILAMTADLPVLGCPTQQLAELIAGLSLVERVICSDGGAMHIAAALGKPMVCFFGSADASVWYPWAVPHVLLQPASRNVADISVSEAVAAWAKLQTT